MTSFGQLNASGTTLRAEATNALVNVNLEFNAFARRYVNPPLEYADVGRHLATARLREAREGIQHAVARRLGALFKDATILPQTPELIKAYGLRASAISRTATANPRGDQSHGAFAGAIGADATTLWAAATSGWSAIQCHLLACLLARIWEPTEATSIWVEIIDKRKRVLKSKLDEEGELDQEVLLATYGDISRSDLFDWDASARAWLRVADRVMAKQQTQAKLIFDNLDIPVNSKPDTYDSVMDAWASSMTQMEKLLCGVPLQLHSGDILLGLLSWHLYPDMKCLFKEEQTIKQNDPILKDRGLLTLGLEPSPRAASGRQSVYWALPLAHLRFYGRLPVTKMRSMRTTDRDRITVDEMLWALISSYIQGWNNGSVPTQSVLQFVGNVAIELHYALGYDRCNPGSSEKHAWLSTHANPSHPSWLTMLSRICFQYKDRLHEERVRKLQAVGRRFHVGFEAPFSGMFNVETYLRAGRSRESKIELLREIVSSKSGSDKTKGSNDYPYLILCQYFYAPPKYDGAATDTLGIFEYVTASPKSNKAGGAKSDNKRWIIPQRPPLLGKNDVEILEQQKLGILQQQQRETIEKQWQQMIEQRQREILERRQREIESMNEKAECFDSNKPVFTIRKMDKPEFYRRQRHHPHRSSDAVMVIEENPGRSRRRREASGSVDSISMHSYTDSGLVNTTKYAVILGSFNTEGRDNVVLLRRQDRLPQDRAPVVIIQRDEQPKVEKDNIQVELTIQQIMNLFQPGSVDFVLCGADMHSPHVTLHAMTLIESLYTNMGNTTIDVRAVQIDFIRAKWIKTALEQASQTKSGRTIIRGLDAGPPPYFHADKVSTAVCFACIAMMETGSYNLDPDELQNVFGLCASDSLYVASCLLRDPADQSEQSPIVRFTGNIGRAGMAFMVPPKDPEIRRYDLIDEWYQYDHNVFTGVMEDCFKGTTLHLSFSDASQAVNVNFSGGPDVEAYFLETLVSVYNRGDWIAELDVLGSMAHPNLRHIYKNCKADSMSNGGTMISIDNFAEMLVPPNQPGIVRAEGNWQARLAAMALCLAKGYRVVIKGPKTCLSCALDASKANNTDLGRDKTRQDILMII
ncbi:hypothetical protein F4777DRAFT_579888 [Nemania sp. FL0916]|nr:hypothetical protein F4777DRAFT_579888 [Nemania sp. FL0916]